MKDARLDMRVTKEVKLKIKELAERRKLSVTELLLLGILKVIKEEELYILEKEEKKEG